MAGDHATLVRKWLSTGGTACALRDARAVTGRVGVHRLPRRLIGVRKTPAPGESHGGLLGRRGVTCSRDDAAAWHRQQH